MKKSVLILAFAASAIFAVAYYDNKDGQTAFAQPAPADSNVNNAKPAVSAQERPAAKTQVAVIDNPQDEQQELSQEEEDLKNFIASGNPEKVMKYFQELRRARAELITNQMNREGVDQMWSQQVTEQFQMAGQLFPKASAVELVNADCRETICALSITLGSFKSYKEVQPMLSKVGILLGTDAWVHRDASPEGPVIYISRPDGVLPDLG